LPTGPRGLAAGEGEGVDIFLQRHAVLRPSETAIAKLAKGGGAFLVHVDEDLADPPSSYSPVQINLVPADHGLRVYLRHFFALAQ
jgi:hypothetical protein